MKKKILVQYLVHTLPVTLFWGFRNFWLFTWTDFGLQLALQNLLLHFILFWQPEAIMLNLLFFSSSQKTILLFVSFLYFNIHNQTSNSTWEVQSLYWLVIPHIHNKNCLVYVPMYEELTAAENVLTKKQITNWSYGNKPNLQTPDVSSIIPKTSLRKIS